MKGLYVIVDPEHCDGRDPLWVADQALAGGCAALQLRAKLLTDGARLALARQLRERCHAHDVPFWMNDRVDLGVLSQADGVHLGQQDLSLVDARRLFPNGLLGVSTHDVGQAVRAGQQAADVIGFGPVFATQSKLRPDPCVGVDGLRAVCARVRVPVIAIGGIELAQAGAIARAGASYAAVISAVCKAADPRTAARELHMALLAG